MPEKEPLIRLFEDPSNPGIYSGCEAPIRWHETLAGRRMPMNADAVPRRSESHPTGRVVAFYAQADSHMFTCPKRSEFSRRKERP
jgi:hypothetical protein